MCHFNLALWRMLARSNVGDVLYNSVQGMLSLSPPSDVNECEEATVSGSLCEGSTCENTEGSYRCNCLPGYVALAEPHRCVPETVQSPAAA